MFSLGIKGPLKTVVLTPSLAHLLLLPGSGWWLPSGLSFSPRSHEECRPFLGSLLGGVCRGGSPQETPSGCYAEAEGQSHFSRKCFLTTSASLSSLFSELLQAKVQTVCL